MVQWSTTLDVGEEIGCRHGELYSDVHRLLRAMCTGVDQHAPERAIDLVEECVAAHFRVQENLMFDTQYPRYTIHKTEHASFIRTLDALKANIARHGHEPASMLRFQQQIGDWLDSHISQSDERFQAWVDSPSSMGDTWSAGLWGQPTVAPSFTCLGGFPVNRSCIGPA